MNTPKSYTVIAVSSNTNSFGYKSILALAPDGTGIAILKQAYGIETLPVRGDTVTEADGYGPARPLPSVIPALAAKIIREATGPVATVKRTTDSFRRSVNGAWLAGGSSTVSTVIPLRKLNTPDGAARLNPGRTGSISVTFEDGSGLHISGANDPLQTYGFGPLGKVGDLLVTRPHPLLPNIVAGYSRVEYLTDDQVATFQPLA